jgi:hypothetical protein
MPQYIPAPLEDELHDVAHEHVKEQQEQQNIQIDQGEKEDIPHQGKVRLELEKPPFEKTEDEQEGQDHRHPHPFPAAALSNRRKIRIIHGNI